MRRALTYAAVLVNVLLLVAGQVLWKQALLRNGGFDAGLAAQPGVWAGLGAYGVATVLWLYALSRLPLAVAYPLQALAYALGVFAARWIFHEPVPTLRWAGVALIILGVALVAARQ